MANRLEINIDGQVLDTAVLTGSNVLDTINRMAIAVDQPGDNIHRSSYVADNVAEADLVLPTTIPLPAVVLVLSREPAGGNTLLIGPKVAGVLARFVEVPAGFPIALFVLDNTATLRYKSLVAPVPFYLRAWSI